MDLETIRKRLLRDAPLCVRVLTREEGEESLTGAIYFRGPINEEGGFYLGPSIEGDAVVVRYWMSIAAGDQIPPSMYEIRFTVEESAIVTSIGKVVMSLRAVLPAATIVGVPLEGFDSIEGWINEPKHFQALYAILLSLKI